MEVQVSLEELRKKKLFVATPCYGGQCLGLYTKSSLDLQALCFRYGIDIKFSMLFNESLIQRARNYLRDEFMRSDFTHCLWIDADIHYDPQHVVTLLAFDKDISGAPYPKKSIHWQRIKDAVLKHPDIEAGKLQELVGEYVFNPVAGMNNFNVTEPMEVLEIGTGFMMVKREVFQTMEEKYPQLMYKPDHQGQPNFDGSRYIHGAFSVHIDNKDSVTGGGTDRLLSEDYGFCQMARKIGYKIHLMPWMKLGHIGTYEFQGNISAVANLVGTL